MLMPATEIRSSFNFWPRLWTWFSLLGGAGWILLAVIDPFEGIRSFGSIGYALTLGPLVIVPLVLSMISTPTRGGRVSLWYKLGAVMHPMASILAVVALLLPAASDTAFFAIPYVIETAVLALFGLSRFIGRGFGSLDEVCIDAGLLYLPIGGAWWFATSAGWTLGFSPLIVELTAVHFHFAGFAIGAMAGLMGRAVPRGASAVRRVYRVGAVVAITAPILIGLGIALSPVVEMIAASALTAAMTALGFLLIVYAAPRCPCPISRLLLGIAGFSLTVPMALALLFAIGEFRGVLIVDLQTMAIGHGLLNAFGFALCGLTGWRLSPSATRCAAPGVPLSKLSTGWRVGADHFDRAGLVIPGRHIAGIVTNLDAYAHAGFDPSTVHGSVRRFYEHTEEFAIHVQAEWSPGFRLAGRLFRRLAQSIGQLNLPLDSVSDSEMRSRLFMIDPTADGRETSRVWVRTYPTDHPAYVAVYSLHCFESTPYMNIAFPLPGGNLSSVLRMDPVPGSPGALQLSTLPAAEHNGDEGVYFVNRWLTVRLPLNETITVWPSGIAPCNVNRGLERPDMVYARHDMWLFGVRYLRIEYELTRSFVLAGASA